MSHTTEWRQNFSLYQAFPRFRYYDLYVDNVYQHTWITYDSQTRKFSLHTYDTNVGEFDAFDEAVANASVLQVIARFEKAYGSTL